MNLKKISTCFLLFVSLFLFSCDNPKKNWEKAIENFNNKNYIESENILNKIIEEYPKSEFVEKAKNKIEEINLIKAQTSWEKAIENFNNKNYIESENILNKIIEEYPKSEFVEKAKNKIEEINLIKDKIKVQKDLEKAMENFNNKNYIESENRFNKIIEVLNKIIEKYPKSEFVEEAKNQIEEINLIKDKIKAKKIIDAIETVKKEIMFGNTTMLQVVKETMGQPDQVITDKTDDILIYGKNLENITNENLDSAPFVVKIPMIGSKALKTLSSSFRNGTRINKGIGKLVCRELDRIEEEMVNDLQNAMIGRYGSNGYAAYAAGQQIANKMLSAQAKAISCEHLFDLQFKRLKIFSYGKKLN